jgi:hypothetical protein
VNAGYTAFEAMALASEHATNLEFLVTLRYKQLDFDRHFDMIRLFGRAARQLTKKEYAVGFSR